MRNIHDDVRSERIVRELVEKAEVKEEDDDDGQQELLIVLVRMIIGDGDKDAL